MGKMKNESLYEKAVMRVILQPVVDEEVEEFDVWNKIEHEYSPEFYQKIAKIFRNERIKTNTRCAVIYGRKIAICFAVIVTLALVACTVIEPIREKFAGAFVAWYEKHYNISYEIEDNLGSPMQPTYVPEGFYEVYREEFENDLILTYENSEMLSYSFTRSENTDNFSAGVDNEKRVMEEIEWNGGKAIYFKPLSEELGHLIVWEDNGYIYSVASDISKEEMLKFAEGVK